PRRFGVAADAPTPAAYAAESDWDRSHARAATPCQPHRTVAPGTESSPAMRRARATEGRTPAPGVSWRWLPAAAPSTPAIPHTSNTRSAAPDAGQWRAGNPAPG